MNSNIIYSFKRYIILVQLINIQKGIKNVANIIKQTDKPSKPRAKNIFMY